MTLERVSQADLLFSPFQPNGSANGRILCMLKRNMYFEYRNSDGLETRLILGGILPFDLMDFGKLSITDTPTQNGKVSLKVDNGILCVSWNKPARTDWILEIGAQFKFKPDNKKQKKI